MVDTTELSPESIQLQEELVTKFENVSPKIGKLVFRGIIAVGENRLSHWLEPGAVVALESELADQAAEDMYEDAEENWQLPRYVLEAVSEIMGVSVEDVLGPEKKQDFVRARWVISYILRERAGLAYLRIAKELGRDHSTIINAVNGVKRKIRDEDSLRGEFTTLVRKAEREVADKLKILDEEKKGKAADSDLLGAVALTKEGMYSYPASKIRILYAKALGIKDPDTLVLDHANRTISDELFQSYGEIALGFLQNLAS